MPQLNKKDLKIIKLSTLGEICEVEVFKINGFVLKELNSLDFHKIITSIGIVSSPANSTRIWYKNNRAHIFDGWESDRYGLGIRNPNYIEALDVTDLLKGI